MTLVLLDLTGAVVERSSRRMPSDDARRIIAAVAGAVEELVDGSGVARDRITGIGVATPGPLDAERGTVIDPPGGARDARRHPAPAGRTPLAVRGFDPLGEP